MPFSEQSRQLLGSEGPFVESIGGFKPRSSQIEMADAVERCLENDGVLVTESGTGTGKTFAYLVPALLSGKKVIVSTGTKPLQDQLFHRDLPSVVDILQVPAKVALLKGRANYVCLHRLRAATEQLEFLPQRRVRELDTIQEWSLRTQDGDLNEIGELGEDSPARPMVSSTVENCLGSKCSFFDNCYINKARKKALSADVLVINHHIFFADLVLQEDGFGRLLPGADAIMFDEAHQLAEVATNFLGISISSNQVRDLARDVDAEERREQSQVKGLQECVADVVNHLENLLLCVKNQKERIEWRALSDDPNFQHRLPALTGAISELSDNLELASPAGEGLTRCWQRSLVCADRLSRFCEEPNDQVVRWGENGQRWFRFHETPLQLGDTLQPYLGDQEKAWVYTSATLSVKGDFSYFTAQLGIVPTDSVCLESSFDYPRQARLFIPEGLPDPRQPHYTREVVSKILPVINIFSGRTFFLFTSYAALRDAHAILSEKTNYNLLVQGEMPRSELLARFRSATDTVLLGTSSFWQGVDVRGQALSCVIIDKLPFESPSDPLLKARLAAIESSGHNPFMEYQLPHAVLSLKQGVGRLIRDGKDFGVLVLCDPRLLSKPYGRVFLASLPTIPLTRNLADIESFFQIMSREVE